ncbi:MAG: CRISPR-associated helicase Cas3', partial [Thermoanaerobacterium sp.]|nr:CRISPR-associated helicase Cas3' [Thermoanaerobacterium sp.]
NLNDVLTEASLDDSDIEIMKLQLDGIDEEKFKILGDNLKKAGLNIDLDKTTVANNIENIKNEMRNIRRYLRKIKESKDLTYYILINYIFSLLIDSDKSDVVIGKISPAYVELMSDAVDKYKSHITYKNSRINALREDAYREVNNSMIDIDGRILSINLPTGLGKTMTSISFALKLRNKLYNVYNKNFRIIYSLPYLSIIEQNYQEFEKILKSNNIDVSTNVLLKHHHLSEVKYSDNETEFDTEKSKIMIEGWNSEIIVTTFIQLFHTLLSNRNSALRKFHRIANSIIILDEIQSIPFYYWKLVKEVLKAVAYKLNSYIIFVTATQPMIFDDNEVKQLTDKRNYFNQMDRVVIKPVLQKDIHLDVLIDMFDLKDGRSYLFILNTISSARQFYQLLKEKLSDEEIIYMSTHVIPYERLERINLLKTKSIKYAVTTQLVEAGVDIDFDVVVRDLAPLDSINQSAGRCNRNWEKKGEVYVVSLIDEKNRKYASRIYDKVMLNITERILSEHEVISEKDFLDIIDRYYREISQNLSSKEAIDILDAVFKLKYDSDDGTPSVSKFKLIDDEYYKVDVFIEYNKEAIDLWQMYTDLKKIKNLFKRRSIFDEFKADFYKYVISIPEKTENMPAEVDGFKYVNNSSIEDYYDSETGFKTSDVLSIW